MDLSEYVNALRSELASIIQFAGQDADAARMRAEALDPAVRLTLLDVLSAAAAEITQRLDDVVVDLRLSSGSPDFVVTARPGMAAHSGDQPAAAPADGPEEAGTARITLRIPESLKARVEAAAAAEGLSVNTWLAHAALRSLDDPHPAGPRRGGFGMGQRITGYARS